MGNWRKMMMGVAVGAALAAGWAGGVWGQGTAPGGAVIGPELDEAIVARAVAKGEAMMAKAFWEAKVPDRNRTLAVAGSMVLSSRQGGPGNPAVALDAKTGKVCWESTAGWNGVAFNSDPLEVTEAGIEGFYPGWGDGPLKLIQFALDTGKATTLWEASRAHAGMPVAAFAGERVVAGGVFISMRELVEPPRRIPIAIVSYDRKTGKEQWATPVPGGAVGTSRPVVAEGKVYVMVDQSERMPEGGAGTYLMALNLADGKILWTKDSTPVKQSMPTVGGGMVLTVTAKGELAAYEAATGKEQWRRVISTKCDAEKAKFTTLNVGSKLEMLIDQDQVLVPAVEDTTGRSFPATNPRPQEAGLAIFELRSGKQVGYFDGVMTKRNGAEYAGIVSPWRPAVYKDTIVLSGYAGIDRKTLQLEWYIKAIDGAVMRDGVVYTTTRTRGSGVEEDVIRAVGLGG